MKYSLMRFGGSIWPRKSRITVYIVPICSDPAEFSVLYPRHLERGKFRDIVGRVITIKQFEGCADRAELAVKEKIKSLLIRRLEGYASKLTAMIAGGIAITILGVINFAFPDPLILVDELLLMVSGTITAVLGYLARRNALPAYRERTEVQIRGINRIRQEAEPFLTRIYRSLCEKTRPAVDGGEDRIEAESRWLYKYIDMGELIDKGEYSAKEIKVFLSNLQDVLPLKRMARLESLSTDRRKYRRFREAIMLKTGFSDDALTVYCEFYKFLKTYFNEKGERI